MRHKFDVELVGRNSRIWMDGQELRGVRDIKIQQSITGAPVIIVEFLAEKIVTRENDDKPVNHA